jgi:hypothetical protein
VRVWRRRGWRRRGEGVAEVSEGGGGEGEGVAEARAAEGGDDGEGVCSTYEQGRGICVVLRRVTCDS